MHNVSKISTKEYEVESPFSGGESAKNAKSYSGR